MTIKKLLKTAKEKLMKISETPDLDAEILLSDIINKPRSFLVAHSNEKIKSEHADKFLKHINRRKNHEPISQIIGKKEFYGLEFFVNKDVLTPRPETEQLIDQILKFFKNKKNGILVDVGTGSGCIAITAAKNLPDPIRVHALDISEKALTIAQKNAKKHSINIKFHQSDLLENLNLNPDNIPLVFVANMPYIPETDELQADVKKHEPATALYAGKTGMDLYWRLFKQIADKYPEFSALIFECDPRQQDEFELLKSEIFPKKIINFFKDLSGTNRGGIIQ